MKGAKCTLGITVTFQVGAGEVLTWKGGVRYFSDEPQIEVDAALKESLDGIRKVIHDLTRVEA